MRKVIAVDFDGCICESKWPEIGEPRQQVINELIKAQAEGAKLILWTCREGELLDAAVMWCLNRGLRFDTVNDNLDENKRLFGNNCRKVWADEYWDDKSVLVVNTGELTSIAFSKPEGGRQHHAMAYAWRSVYSTQRVNVPYSRQTERMAGKVEIVGLIHTGDHAAAGAVTAPRVTRRIMPAEPRQAPAYVPQAGAQHPTCGKAE